MPLRKTDVSPKLHRKRRANQRPGECEIVDVVSSSKTGQKIGLKIKMKPSRDSSKARKSIKPIPEPELMTIEATSIDDEDLTADGMEDDEEEWLDALEKGDLDDYGELKKEKDPSLMTARQRAMKDRASGSCSFTPSLLPGSGSKVQVMSEEAQKRKEEKNKRRKLQAVKKAEESQKQTIERLVKQQGVRGSKDRLKKANANNSEVGTNTAPQQTAVKSVPMIKYSSKGNLITLSYPEYVDFPLKAKSADLCKAKPPCIMCGSPKRYNCSKTKVPLCSLECYKNNLAKAAG